MTNDSSFVSPFLNFDPAILVTDPKNQYLYPDAADQRNMFEKSSFEIGSFVLVGGALGGAIGFISYLNDTRKFSKSLNNVLMLNNMIKPSADLAQKGGSLGLIFVMYRCALHYGLDFEDDHNLKLASATLTGASYGVTQYLREPVAVTKSISTMAKLARFRPILKSSGLGLIFGLAYVGLENWETVKNVLLRKNLRY